VESETVSVHCGTAELEVHDSELDDEDVVCVSVDVGLSVPVFESSPPSSPPDDSEPPPPEQNGQMQGGPPPGGPGIGGRPGGPQKTPPGPTTMGPMKVLVCPSDPVSMAVVETVSGAVIVERSENVSLLYEKGGLPLIERVVNVFDGSHASVADDIGTTTGYVVDDGVVEPVLPDSVVLAVLVSVVLAVVPVVLAVVVAVLDCGPVLVVVGRVRVPLEELPLSDVVVPSDVESEPLLVDDVVVFSPVEELVVLDTVETDEVPLDASVEVVLVCPLEPPVSVFDEVVELSVVCDVVLFVPVCKVVELAPAVVELRVLLELNEVEELVAFATVVPTLV
jgi:hypothetical protein